jgi:hypothetical protein
VLLQHAANAGHRSLARETLDDSLRAADGGPQVDDARQSFHGELWEQQTLTDARDVLVS